MSGSASAERRAEFGACLALTAANVLAFWPVRSFPFLGYDDNAYVTANPVVQKGLTLGTLAWAWTTGYFSYWHPLTWMSHMLDIQLYGGFAGGHHVTNLLIHMAATIVLFLALHRMTRSIWPSAFVAALFAVHPLHVQTVAWISERKGVLSTLFWMLTLLAYAGYARAPSIRRYVMVAACLAMALMSKPMAVTIPLVLLLLDVWPLGRLFKGEDPAAVPSRALRLVLEKAPLLALSAASAAATLYVVGRQGNLLTPSTFPVTHAAPYAAYSYFTYIRMTLWPSGLSAFYPFPSVLHGWHAVAAAFALAAVSLGCLREAKRRPYLAVGWFWFLLTLLPVIGLVQSQGQTIADRYTYVPLIGLFIVAAWGAPELLGRIRGHEVVVRAGGALIIAACLVASRREVLCWESDKALWTRALEVTGDNFLAENNLGDALANEGDVEGAARHFREAVRLNSSYGTAMNNLGAALTRQGRVKEALPHFLRALELDPNDANAHHNLSAALAIQGDLTKALAEGAEAIRLDPSNSGVHVNMALLLARKGNLRAAIAECRQALRISPERPAAHAQLGGLLAQRGEFAEARRHLEEALALDPSNREFRRTLEGLSAKPRSLDAQRRSARNAAGASAEAHNESGSLLLSENRPDEAAREFREALRLKPSFAEARSNLGIALAAQGRNADALEAFKTAVALHPDFVDARFNLAVLLHKEGKTEAALAELEGILKGHPENAKVRAAIAELRR